VYWLLHDAPSSSRVLRVLEEPRTNRSSVTDGIP
jgi:hypothetical protein